MNGFLHYFLSAVDPMSNLGFSRAFPKLMTSALPSWWLEVVLPVGSFVLPAVIVWLAYVANSAPDRTRLGAQTRQAEPLVSVVTAGRNESATIGRCVRGALQCGYSNLEFIFVDDNSTDESVAVARRAALSVTRSRHDTARVRIFPSPRRNGKASSLTIGIRMARGEFIVIHDADSIIQYGAIQHWLRPFADPRVGGVAANIRVDNSTVNLLTRMQEVEYAMKFTLSKFFLSKIFLMDVISGMAGIFRGEVIRRLGGFDTGLGDDRDLSTMLLKQRFRLAFSNEAVVWTTVPETRYHHLWRQRMRWRRNIIKIRLSKHRDLFMLGRYGFANAVIAMQLGVRLLIPATLLIGLLWAFCKHGLARGRTRSRPHFLLDPGRILAGEDTHYTRCREHAQTGEFSPDLSLSFLRRVAGAAEHLCRVERALSHWGEAPLRAGPHLGGDTLVVRSALHEHAPTGRPKRRFLRPSFWSP
jgi:cellulose synthase/poly-beta-1,6-N-acetylglucosamine synthase-like glycosyltransferase